MANKQVYSYHPVTFEYMGLEIANESPLEPGVYLIPAHATEIPMDIKLKKTEYAIFDAKNQKWLSKKIPKIRKSKKLKLSDKQKLDSILTILADTYVNIEKIINT